MTISSKKPSSTELGNSTVPDPISGELEQTILRALRGLKYGQITIAVQEGRVTQVDRSEHTRHFRNKLTHS